MHLHKSTARKIFRAAFFLPVFKFLIQRKYLCFFFTLQDS